jgi:hypothetical protein
VLLLLPVTVGVAQFVTACHTDSGGDWFVCDSGGKLQMNAGSTAVFSGDMQATVVRVNSTPVFWATPERNITATVILANSVSVAGTPVVWATPPGNITATVVNAASLNVAGTPVVWATPPVLYGTTPVSEICGSQIITGTGYLVTGLTTPAAVGMSLGGDVNYDHSHVSFTNSAATVTAKVWSNALTPVASGTGVAVDWCVRGTK